MTSHAQSTAATYFAVAVKSDVVYFIMVCLVLLLQLLQLIRLATLGCRRAFFAHACVKVKFMSILLSCIPPAIKQAEVLGMNSPGRSYAPQRKTLGVLHHMHGAPLPHNAPVR